jgi:hypothetical protein
VAKVHLFRPDARDLAHIAANLRISDADELLAVHGPRLDIERCLNHAFDVSDEAHVALTGYGEPMAVFGVAPVSLLGGQGCPWMLGTDTLDLYGRAIVTLSRQHVARWSLRYSELFNYVDARNLRSIAWLRRTGFTIGPAAPWGVQGLPFHRFGRCT